MSYAAFVSKFIRESPVRSYVNNNLVFVRENKGNPLFPVYLEKNPKSVRGNELMMVGAYLNAQNFPTKPYGKYLLVGVKKDAKVVETPSPSRDLAVQKKEVVVDDDAAKLSKKLSKILQGKRVMACSAQSLTLEDGTVLHLYESDRDCCANASGEWVIDASRMDAMITNVVVDVIKDRKYNGDGHDSYAVIKILHNQNPIALGECHANDGNGGYYYSVLSLRVSLDNKVLLNDKVVSA